MKRAEKSFSAFLFVVICAGKCQVQEICSASERDVGFMQIWCKFSAVLLSLLFRLCRRSIYADGMQISCLLPVDSPFHCRFSFVFTLKTKKKQSKNETTLEPSRCVSYPWVIVFFKKKFWTECNLMRFLFHFFCTQNWCDLIPIFLMQTKVDEAL